MLAGIYGRLIGAGAIALLVGAAWLYVAHLKSEVGALTQENASLTGRLEAQNAAVLKLKTDSDERVAAGQVLVQKAQAEAAVNKGRAKVIYKAVPATPGDACKSALTLMNSTASP